MSHARSLRWCLLIATLLLIMLPAPRQPVAAQPPTSPALTADPTTLALSIPLGTQATRTVTLTNSSGATLTPALYEAYPEPPANLAIPARQPRPGVRLPEQSERIDTRLRADFQSALDGRADFLVYLHDQADLSAAYTIRDWAERGRYVYRTLSGWAERSQRGLRAQLAARGLNYRPFWIVNAVLVHGGPEDAQALAARADVALIRANRITALPPPARTEPVVIPGRCNPEQSESPICWNIQKIGADRVWQDFGVTGQGIVVANIDSGVSYSHPALVPHYRGYQGPGSFDHNYNWYDPQGTLPAPADSNGHGTHTMGTIVAAGDGTLDQPALGVAPGARWIAAQGCGGTICTEGDLVGSAQWVLAPTALDGTSPRPDLRPMIVNNSWGGAGGDPWYAGYTAAWRAAGIFPVFAAGNSSNPGNQKCGTISSPGDYPEVVSVGATDHTDSIATFSLLGPTRDGRVKPDFVAPGTYTSYQQGLLSTFIGDGLAYQQLQGTSMATPHVSGLVALLWSANPALIGDYDATYAILRETVLPLSDTRCQDQPGAPNNVYGQGRIDALAAVARARVDLPWLIAPASAAPVDAAGTTQFDITFDAARVPGPGTYPARLQIFGADLGQTPTTIDITLEVTPAAQQAVVTGRVVSAANGAPVAAIVGLKYSLGAPTDSAGTFSLTLPLGSHELLVTAPSYLPLSHTIELTGDLTLPVIILQPDLPHLLVATEPLSASLPFMQQQRLDIPISNTGTRGLHYSARVLTDRFGIWRSDEPGGPSYNWIDLPPDAATLTLADNEFKDEVPLGIDFPFFSYTLTETLVTSDGMLTFVEPFNYGGPANRCLPADEIFFYMIAAFRADLDPSAGGAVRYGTLADTQTFVLSYEQVPLRGGAPDQTYTFQVLLHSDGRIVLQYKELGPLPANLSVGVQRTLLEVESIGCGTTTPIHNGLAIELRPQVFAPVWLTSDTSGELAAGGQATVAAMLYWTWPETPQPYRGRIEITSTDPLHPQIIVPVEITVTPASHEQRLVMIFYRL